MLPVQYPGCVGDGGITPVQRLSQDCCCKTGEDGGRPGRPLRLTLTDVASASSRDQSLRSPPESVLSDCGASRSHENNITTTGPGTTGLTGLTRPPRIMHNDFPYLHSAGTSCVVSNIQFHLPFTTVVLGHSTHWTYHALVLHSPYHKPPDNSRAPPPIS